MSSLPIGHRPWPLPRPYQNSAHDAVTPRSAPGYLYYRTSPECSAPPRHRCSAPFVILRATLSVTHPKYRKNPLILEQRLRPHAEFPIQKPIATSVVFCWLRSRREDCERFSSPSVPDHRGLLRRAHRYDRPVSLTRAQLTEPPSLSPSLRYPSPRDARNVPAGV